MANALSDTQLTILSAACQRDDGNAFPITAKLKGGAVGNILKSLLRKALLEEIVATLPDTVWRTRADGTPLTLRATPAANEALGIEPTDRGTPPAQEAAAAPESTAPSDSAGSRATTKGERGRGRARSGPKANRSRGFSEKGQGWALLHQ